MAFRPCLKIGGLAGLLLVASACSTGPDIDLTLHESTQGAVYLERFPDRTFQAAHPIKIAPATIASVLRGVLVRNEQGLLQNLIAGKPDALRAFTEEDVAYLTPLIVEGLARAASDQQIGFRVSQIGSPGYSQSVGAGVGSSEPPLQLHPHESTGAVLYAYGRSLYLTLTQYRHRLEPATTINMANRRVPDSTGLANHNVLFTPESAKRPDSFLNRFSTAHTVVIDYELLASMPAEVGIPASARTEPSAAAPQPGTSVKEQPAPSNAELEALRKELQDIRRQLAEQEAERTRSQPKKSAPPK